MLLPDWMIRRDISIEPFSEATSAPGLVSWGLQSFGYDLRLGRHFKVFEMPYFNPLDFGKPIIDPANMPAHCIKDFEGDTFILPAHGFALAESVEYMRIPRGVTALVVDKSTWRRCGILMGATIGEAGWEGRYTLEITNSTPLPACLRAGSGIAQVLFIRGEGYPTKDYAEKGGRYQGQKGLTLPHVLRGLAASQTGDPVSSRPS